MTVNDFLINESVSLLFIGNGLGYLMPPMIVTGPENAFNQSESSNNFTHWSENAFGQELSLKLSGLFKIFSLIESICEILKSEVQNQIIFLHGLTFGVAIVISGTEKMRISHLFNECVGVCF